ncbi:Dedicator of cytokinesis protein 11 [Geodia barretti]|nr:Dedicator of cytokinesis protein 11 [Geodia barretti]
MLHVSTSATLQSHIFNFLRIFIHNFRESLFKGSAEYCGILCFEILRCCNSKMSTTRSEACSAFYLMMKTNNELFRSQGFVRCHVQATIAVSRLVSTLLGESDTNLRRSLATIANFVKDDTKIKRGSAFPTEVAELMKRLKTILNATSQMKAHQNDPEKLMDLHYSLAKSYSNSPELRQTWLDSMTALHLKAGNYSEAAHCSIHIAGLVAECLKLQKENAHGCAAFTHISPNIEMEERGMREDKGTAGAEDHSYTQPNLVSLLETSMDYFEQGQRYEVMSEVAKLLQPFYEDARDSKSMMEMYGKLHQAYRKVVDIEESGRRYLGTYFRVAFFGRPFGDDHEKQYIYKEPAVTTLAEIVLRLQKLYSRKFGPGTPVNIVQESGRVDIESLASNHANIQITHVEPYFTEDMLQDRTSRFERTNNLSRFVFEAPFTRGGKQQGDVTRQCMRKTVLTTSHWFPYIKKRILVIHQEQFELSPIEVAIEAMQRKTSDLVAQVQRSPPDLKRLQLLLQGCVSTQVNQGVQEYAVFLSQQHSSELSSAQISQLKTVYRSMMDACQHSLDLNESLISTDQLLYHQDMKSKFQKMLTTLNPLIADDSDNDDRVAHGSDTYPRAARRSQVGLDPHRMSAILFSSISGAT